MYFWPFHCFWFFFFLQCCLASIFLPFATGPRNQPGSQPQIVTSSFSSRAVVVAFATGSPTQEGRQLYPR
jgi:hypothetical protein